MRPSRLGTSEWTTPDELARRHPFCEAGFWLGRGLTDAGAPVTYDDDRHVCLVSGSRGGKGTSTIIPNLCTWPGSLVVVDPKGENATITAARRGDGSEHCRGLGQRVHVLDPFNAAQVSDKYRSSFNPLDTLDPASDASIDEAGRLADAIVVVRPDAKDPFWEESARTMVKGLILHVLTAPKFEGRRNLLTVRELVQRGDWQSVEALRSVGDEDIPSAHELLWEGMARNSALHGVIAGIGEGFRSMAGDNAKGHDSVRQIAARNTEFLDSPGMRACLERSSFALSELKTDPAGVSVFLSLPNRYMAEHFRWLRMMISLVVTEMEATPGRPASGHRVLLCLDEFAGLKRMEVVQNAVAQIAGYGVKLFFVLQSLEQLRSVYDNAWETFLANAGVKVFYGIEDHFTREYVSKLAGETELIRETRSTSESISENESTTRGVSNSTSISENESSSVSSSSSRSSNWGGNSSSSRSVSKGTNSSTSHSTGQSEGHSWSPSLFLRGLERDLAFLRDNEQMNTGQNSSVSKSAGANRSVTSGTSRGSSWGESVSDTHGSSTTRGSSRSETHGTSESESRGAARSESASSSETVHRRALISPDEVGYVFARQAMDHPAYPGLALLLIAGERPAVVRRTNYFEDIAFLGKYDFHPDHPPTIPNVLKALVRKPAPPKALYRINAPPHELLGEIYAIEYSSGLIRDRDAEGKTPDAVCSLGSKLDPGTDYELHMTHSVPGATICHHGHQRLAGGTPIIDIEPNREHPEWDEERITNRFYLRRLVKACQDYARRPPHAGCGCLLPVIALVAVVGWSLASSVNKWWLLAIVPATIVVGSAVGTGLEWLTTMSYRRRILAIARRCASENVSLIEEIPVPPGSESRVFNYRYSSYERVMFTPAPNIHKGAVINRGDVIGHFTEAGKDRRRPVTFYSEHIAGETPVYVTGLCVSPGDWVTHDQVILSFGTTPPSAEEALEGESEKDLVARYVTLAAEVRRLAGNQS